MDFDHLFTGPAVLAKQLEARWGGPSSSSSQLRREARASSSSPRGNRKASKKAANKSKASGKAKAKKADPPASPGTNNNTSTDDDLDLDRAILSAMGGTGTGMSRRPYLRRNLLYCRDPLAAVEKPKSRWRPRSQSVDGSPLKKNVQRSADLLPKLDLLDQLFDHDGPDKPSAGGQDRDEKNKKKKQKKRSIDGTSAGRANGGQLDVSSSSSSSSSSDGNISSAEENRKREHEGALIHTPPRKKKKKQAATKMFFDVQMAQSPSKVLSPTTAEMQYGKAFPPYEPRGEVDAAGATKEWIPPRKPRTAFELFADGNLRKARLNLKRGDRKKQVCMHACVRTLCGLNSVYWLFLQPNGDLR
jgi:hypothetical protein